MNLISKQETINVLAARAEEIGGIGRTYFERAIQIVAAIPDAEVKQETATEWTPANKNPKKKGNYLVHIVCPEGKWIEIDKYEGKGTWINYNTAEKEDASDYVTHWRPLPKEP